MTESFNFSKIRPPRALHIVHRDRLIEALEQHREKKIILILGQAAQGKSTLAAAYSDRCHRPSAWINLSPEESDPVNLFRVVIQSIQYALKNDGLGSILQYVAMDMGPRAETALYRGWVQALLARIASPLQIILDGLEQLAPEAPSFRLLQVLHEEADSKIRLVLLSRTEPPLAMQQLKIRREAAVIDNEQLAFTLEETQAFFREMHDLSLSLDQVKKIHAFTEGWVGGLLLFSEAFKRRPESVQKHLFSEQSVSELKREAFRYLGEEIFSSLDQNVREFLIKSSILDVIDPVLAKELLETEDVEAILKELSEKNLFTQTLYDPKHGWLFRYHQLFREFLRARFESETTREERLRLFAGAGYIYAQREEYESALDCYLEAKAYREAASVIERIGMDLLQSGRIGELAKRLQMIPDGLIQHNPWLLYYLSITRRFTATRENTQSFLKCFRVFEERGDTRGQILSLAFLIEAYIFGGHHPVPMEGLISRAENLLESIPRDVYADESAMLWLQVGQAWTVSCGNPRKGFWCCKKAYLIAGPCGDSNLQGSALTRAIDALAWLGEFEAADELCLELTRLVEASPYPELQTYQLFALTGLAMLKGETGKARELVRLAQSAVEKHGLISWYNLALAADLFISVYRGELEEAENIANHMLDLGKSLGNRVFEGIALFFIAWIFYHKGEWLKAIDLVGQARPLLASEESLALYHYHAAVVVRSFLLRHLEEEGGVEEELQQTIDHLSNVPDYLVLIDAHLAMAFWKKKQGKVDEAASHLEKGFKLAEQKKHYHTALLSREDFADACALALELDVTPAVEYASHLLATHLVDLADSGLRRLEAHPHVRTAKKARKLRETIYRSSLPRLRIECFGNLQVWRGDQLIEEGEWQGVQARNLLKALIVRGAWQIPREVLMEDLWPESEPQSAEKNFKITLHRLRKVLEPGLHKSYGSSYLHLKDNQLSLHKDLCSIDVKDFLALTERGQQEEAGGNFKEALSWWAKAIDLYRGDFLEKDLYLSWVETKREELRKRYVQVLSRMASLLEKQGKAKRAIECYQKIIQVEPVMEEAYQRIMSLHADRGMRSAALRTYEECRNALLAELDSEPGEVTTALYRKIVE